MSSLFDNYDNLGSQYIPSNMNCQNTVPKNNPFLEPVGPKRPYEERNAQGELIGYWWTYGDTVDLDFELSGDVTIDGEDSYIDVRDFIKDKQLKIELFNFRHEEINTTIYEGKDYATQTTYKVADVCKLTSGIYYTYNNGTYEPVVLPTNYQAGVVYYEQEPIHVVKPIDLTLSQELVKGTYYCSFSIISTDLSATVFYQDSCTLVVK